MFCWSRLGDKSPIMWLYRCVLAAHDRSAIFYNVLLQPVKLTQHICISESQALSEDVENCKKYKCSNNKYCEKVLHT